MAREEESRAFIVAIALGVRRWSDPRHCFGLSSAVVLCGLGGALRGGGGGRAARIVGSWTSGRGFESHRAGLESSVIARGGKVPGHALVHT